MTLAMMSGWHSGDVPDIWECVDRMTYGTPDEEEDMLLLAHARVELRALSSGRPQPAEMRQAAVTQFREVVSRRKVG